MPCVSVNPGTISTRTRWHRCVLRLRPTDGARQMISFQFSFCVSSETKFFYYYYDSHDILYRFSINTETKLRKGTLRWPEKKISKIKTFQEWKEGKMFRLTFRGKDRCGKTSLRQGEEETSKKGINNYQWQHRINRTWKLLERQVLNIVWFLHDSFSSGGGEVIGRRKSKMWGSVKKGKREWVKMTHCAMHSQTTVPGWWIM